MKYLSIIALLLLSIFNGKGQDCYQDYLDQGIEAYNQLDFELAINLFEAGKICPENTEEQIKLVDEWIDKSESGYIDAIKQARDDAIQATKTAVTAQQEAEKQALLSEANRLAYLASQELRNNNNIDALPLAYLALDLVKDGTPPLVRQTFGNVVAHVYKRNFNDHNDEVVNAGFIGSKELIWSSSSDKTVKLWEMSGSLVKSFTAKEGKIGAVVVSPDTERIAIGDQGGNIAMLDVSGSGLISFKGHEASITSLSFSPNSESLLTGAQDGSVKMWDLEGNLIWEINSIEAPIYQMEFYNSGASILIRPSGNTLFLMDYSGNEAGRIDHEKYIFDAVVTPDGQRILTSSGDRSAALWNNQGSLIRRFPHDNSVHIVRYIPEEDRIVTVSTDHNFYIWGVSGNKLATMSGHRERILGVRISSDNSYILSWSGDGTAKIWDSQGNLVSTLGQHTDEVVSAAFSPDNTLVITASRDQRSMLWTLAGNLLMTVDTFKGEVKLGKFSDDGKDLLFCSKENNVIVINNPVDVFRELQKTPPDISDEFRLKFGVKK